MPGAAQTTAELHQPRVFHGFVFSFVFTMPHQSLHDVGPGIEDGAVKHPHLFHFPRLGILPNPPWQFSPTSNHLSLTRLEQASSGGLIRRQDLEDTSELRKMSSQRSRTSSEAGTSTTRRLRR